MAFPKPDVAPVTSMVFCMKLVLRDKDRMPAKLLPLENLAE
jgi:hypothetical protein